MSDAPKAVFLSYAREDLEASRRIAEALRSSGIEVWFDVNELRGGDAWDQKIRRQIKECALFLPIISAQTQERGEGYFRLEWKLAVERSHLMAEGVPFFMPVVIDGTAESAGLVPEPFMRVQWVRLPGALPTPQFVEQVQRMLAAPRKAPAPVRPESRAAVAPVAAKPKGGLPKWLWAAPVAIAMGVAAFFSLRKPEPPAAPTPTKRIPTTPTATAR